MKRPPTFPERQRLLRLYRNAGGREGLIGWLDDALAQDKVKPKVKPGPKKIAIKFTLGALCELIGSRTKRRAELIKELARGNDSPAALIRKNLRKIENEIKNDPQWKAWREACYAALDAMNEPVRAAAEIAEQLAKPLLTEEQLAQWMDLFRDTK